MNWFSKDGHSLGEITCSVAGKLEYTKTSPGHKQLFKAMEPLTVAFYLLCKP